MDYIDRFQSEIIKAMSTTMFSDMKNMVENSQWHREPNVGVHTVMTLNEVIYKDPNISTFGQFLAGVAVLYHDFGKPVVAVDKENPDGSIRKSSPGHEIASARIFENIAGSTDRFTPYESWAISWMIENHLPWGTKNPKRLDQIAATASAIGWDAFNLMVMSDQRGRIADDQDTKLAEAEKELGEIGSRVFEVDVRHILPTSTFIERTSDVETNQKKPKLYVPIAVSGSGKSTLASSIATDVAHYSWDDLRLKWYGGTYTEAFKRSTEDSTFLNRAMAEFRTLIKRGQDIIIDNTNLSRKRRAQFLDEAARHGYCTVACVSPVSLQTVLDRQSTRSDKSVPLHAVIQQYGQLSQPSIGEFDVIWCNDWATRSVNT